MADVQLASGGDSQAFGRVIESYRHAVTSVALGCLRSIASSEEIAQESFLNAWRALPTLRNPESFGPWTLQLVRRQALQALRSNKRSTERESPWEDPRVPSKNAAERLEQREAESLITRALELVPDDAPVNRPGTF